MRHRTQSAGLVATRALLALLLLAGMVAMHQLAGGAHDAGRAGAAPMSVGPGQHDAMPLALDPGPASMPTALDLGPAAALLSATGMPPMEACLAALLAALLLVLARGRGWRTVASTPVPFRHGLCTAPPGRGPPRDLLAQLCVLRT